MQPTIVSEGDGRTDRVLMKVAASTVIEVGDLLYASVGKIYAVTASTEDSKFAGIAGESSLSTQSNGITVHTKCVIDVDVTLAASYYVGRGLSWASDNTLEDDGNANTFGWVHENVAGTTARLKVLIDVPRVRKLYTVST